MKETNNLEKLEKLIDQRLIFSNIKILSWKNMDVSNIQKIPYYREDINNTNQLSRIDYVFKITLNDKVLRFTISLTDNKKELKESYLLSDMYGLYVRYDVVYIKPSTLLNVTAKEPIVTLICDSIDIYFNSIVLYMKQKDYYKLTYNSLFAEIKTRLSRRNCENDEYKTNEFILKNYVEKRNLEYNKDTRDEMIKELIDNIMANMRSSEYRKYVPHAENSYEELYFNPTFKEHYSFDIVYRIMKSLRGVGIKGNTDREPKSCKLKKKK